MGTTTETGSQMDGGANTSAPVLVLRLKKKTQGRFELSRTRLTLGRASDSDIVLDDSSGVSRNHAHILVVDDEVVVEDLGSRNGTFVNGKLTTRRTLRPGDRIAIGHYRLHFIVETASAEDRKAPRNEITELFRLWGPAAVASDPLGCALCNAFVDNGDYDTSAVSETGEHIRIDEACSDWFADVASDEAPIPGAQSIVAGPINGHDFPDIPDDDSDEAEESEDEIMARVERLVGLAITSDDIPPETHATPVSQPQPAATVEEQPEPEPEPEPAPELEAVSIDSSPGKHDVRAKLMSRKSKQKRRSASRSKPKRKSRLSRKQKTPAN